MHRPIPAPESEPLAYAPPAAWHERPTARRAFRWGFVAGVVAVAMLLTWATARRAFMLHHQKSAMNFVAPPDAVAFTNDPAESAKLLASGTDYVPGIGARGAAMLSIAPLRRLSEIEDEQYAFGYAFAHARRAEGGSNRLVKVCLPFVHAGGTPTLYLEPRLRPIFTMLGSNEGLRSMDLTGRDALRVRLHPADRFRLFAGRPDPVDEAHFTFRYELNDEPGTIDGYLMPDDSVKIEPRDGPLRNRSR
jgi:hypothetical protein